MQSSRRPKILIGRNKEEISSRRSTGSKRIWLTQLLLCPTALACPLFILRWLSLSFSLIGQVCSFTQMVTRQNWIYFWRLKSHRLSFLLARPRSKTWKTWCSCLLSHTLSVSLPASTEKFTAQKLTYLVNSWESSRSSVSQYIWPQSWCPSNNFPLFLSEITLLIPRRELLEVKTVPFTDLKRTTSLTSCIKNVLRRVTLKSQVQPPSGSWLRCLYLASSLLRCFSCLSSPDIERLVLTTVVSLSLNIWSIW